MTDTERIQTQGDTENTGNSLDLLVQGEGFFVVQHADGGEAYTRSGSLRVDADRRLVTASGHVLQPEIALPEVGSKAVVTGDITQVDLEGRPSGLAEVGQILAGVPGIAIVHLDRRDVVRHPLVKAIIEAYERSEREPGADGDRA